MGKTMVADYAKMPGVNWSSLKYMATSPLLYRYRMDHPEEDKDAFVRGGGVHCGVLEPQHFNARYAVYDDKRDNRVAAWREWQEAHPGVRTFKSHELVDIVAACKAVHAHPVAARHLGVRKVDNVEVLHGAEVFGPAGDLLGYVLDNGRVEAPIKWVDPDTGMQCKGRTDFIRPRGVTDLKSAREVAKREFERAMAKYLYHGQLSWYHHGAIFAGLIPPDSPPPFVVAVQAVAPYDVAVYQMNIIDLAAGRALGIELMQKLMACTESNYWPGVQPELEQLQLPAWAPGLAEEGEAF